MLSRDFAEMLSALSAAGAEFLVVAGMPLPFIGKAALVRNKRAAARPKDLVDADILEKIS